MDRQKSTKDTRFKRGQSGNPNGRPPGSSNKVPSDREIIEGFKKLNKSALNKLGKIIAEGKDADALKAAIKILDVNYQIVLDERKEKNIREKVVKVPKQEPKEIPEEPKAEVIANVPGEAKILRLNRDK